MVEQKRERTEHDRLIWDQVERMRAKEITDADEAKPLVKDWFTNCGMPGLTWLDVWPDFLHAWDRWDDSKQGKLSKARARAAEMPPIAELEEYDDTDFMKVAKLCRALQIEYGDNDFHLSNREAGEYIEKSHETARDHLHCLLNLNMMRLTKKGEWKLRAPRASEYRWLGPLEEVKGRVDTSVSSVSSISSISVSTSQ